MNLLSKRETPVQNIAYIAIMSAINAVFVLISNLLPVLFVLLVFLLPLTSVIVTIYCKKMYIPIYAIVTLAICFGISAGFSIFDTFIYVFPSLVTGILFGLMIKNNIPAIYMIVGISIVQYLLTSLTFLFISRVVTNFSLFDSIYNMIGLQNFQYKQVLTDILTFVIAEIQVALTYCVVKYEMNRANIKINLECKNRLWLYIIVICDAIIMVLSHYFFPNYTILITLIALPIIVYMTIDLMLKKDISVYITMGLSVVIFVFLFAYAFPYIHSPNQLSLIYIFFIEVTIIDTLFNYCFNAKAKIIE